MVAEAWDVLVRMSMLALVLAVVLLSVRLPLRKAFGARVAYLIWLVAPISSLALLLPAALPTPVAIAREQVLGMASVLAVPIEVDAFDARLPLLLAWVFGVLSMLTLFAVRQVRFERRMRCSKVRSGGLAHDSLFTDARVNGPAVLGVFRPRVVLPDDFEVRFSPLEQKVILAHEEAHIKRGDTRVNALVALVRALNWFNPLVHYAAARMRVDQELSCDAIVMASFPHARRSYAEAMLKTQFVAPSPATLLPPFACSWTDAGSLKERIAMLSQPMPSRSLRKAGFLVILTLVGVMTCAVWAAQAPQARQPLVVSRGGAGPMIDATVSIGIDKASPPVQVTVSSGMTYIMHGGDRGKDAWDAELTPRLLDDGLIELAMVIRAEGRMTATPSIVVNPGETATIEIGAPEGMSPLQVSATLAPADEAIEVEKDVGVLSKRDEASLVSARRPLRELDEPFSTTLNVRVRIGMDGRPLSVLSMQGTAAAITSTQIKALEEIVRATVKTWNFQPAMHDGKPVESEVMVPLVFGRQTNP